MKKVFLVICAAMFFLSMTGIGNALIITETTTDNAEGMIGLQFDVYNDYDPGMAINAGVYSFLIGASEPAGSTFAGGYSGWNGATVEITPYTKYDFWGNSTQVYRVYEEGEDSSPILELTGAEWANYNHGYFYWTYYQEIVIPYGFQQLGWKHSMTVYALTDSEPASPFAYTDYAIDFDNLPENGYTPTGYGETKSPVPIPGALWLLGSGLFGLVAIRRKRV